MRPLPWVRSRGDGASSFDLANRESEDEQDELNQILPLSLLFLTGRNANVFEAFPLSYFGCWGKEFAERERQTSLRGLILNTLKHEGVPGRERGRRASVSEGESLVRPGLRVPAEVRANATGLGPKRGSKHSRWGKHRTPCGQLQLRPDVEHERARRHQVRLATSLIRKSKKSTTLVIMSFLNPIFNINIWIPK